MHTLSSDITIVALLFFNQRDTRTDSCFTKFVFHYFDLNSVGISHVFFGDDVISLSREEHIIPLDQCDMSIALEDMVGKVGSHDNAQTIISGQIADALQNMHLVAKIEIGCRLIQHQKNRFLGKRAGDEHHLPFAAADFRHRESV